MAKVYGLYHETVHKYVEEEKANVQLAMSTLGQNYALPSMHDQSQMSSFYDQIGNQNDAQIQGEIYDFFATIC